MSACHQLTSISGHMNHYKMALLSPVENLQSIVEENHIS